MLPPKKPANESSRIEALERYDVLDTLPEQIFDDLTLIASQICETPVALISLVDSDRQWFKSRVGLDTTETPREVSFCGHVVADGQMLVVPDAALDERFADNPLVTDDPNIRFYAGAPLISPEGYTLGALCVTDSRPRELSDAQRRALEALARQVIAHLERRVDGRSSPQVYDRFFELTLELLCVAGFDGYFTRLNPEWSRLLGWTREELKSKPFIEFVHPEDREATIAEASRLEAGGTTISFENRYLCKGGGSRWLRWRVTTDPERQVFLAAARDISRDRALEEQLRQAVSAAQDANLAKSAFLANMSHELRTPLNSVIGFTNLLAKNRDGRLEARQLRYLDRIRANGTHLLSLINDVLDLSKIEARHLEFAQESVDLTALALEVVAQMEPASAEAGAPLEFEVPGAPVTVVGDRQRLKQILLNLLGNALKFGAGRPVSLRLVTGGGAPWRLDVVDRGPGIAPAALDLIFEPFRQAEESTARRFGGTGLGLPISRSLCRGMGFELAVDSVLGEGATFSICFSPEAPRPRHQRATTLTHEASPSRHRRVLVIDDDPDALEIMEANLRALGHDCECARSGAEGLARASARPPDLILLDLMMPGLSGWDVLRALRAAPALRRIPVVICSVVGSQNRASVAGTVEVIDKPVDRDELSQVLARYLGGEARVLVVEDDPDTQTVLVEMLTDLGYAVCAAGDGAEALATLHEFAPELIVLDLRMPHMDGFRFLEFLRNDPRHGDVPVLICSASEQSPAERELLARKTQGRLPKQALDPDQLAAITARALRKHRNGAGKERS